MSVLGKRRREGKKQYLKEQLNEWKYKMYKFVGGVSIGVKKKYM